MEVELTVLSFEDVAESRISSVGRGGERECKVKLAGRLDVPQLPGQPAGGYTHDGRFVHYSHSVGVSLHLETRNSGLQSLQVGTKLKLILPDLNPPMPEMTIDQKYLDELRAKSSSCLGPVPSRS